MESTRKEGDDGAATGGERSVESTRKEGDDGAATGGERSVESTRKEGDDGAATGGERSVESTPKLRNLPALRELICPRVGRLHLLAKSVE